LPDDKTLAESTNWKKYNESLEGRRLFHVSKCRPIDFAAVCFSATERENRLAASRMGRRSSETIGG
jgi:hypothetical protein